jgi:hypothetical protein
MCHATATGNIRVPLTDQKLNGFIESINRKTYVSRNCHW